MAKIEHLRAEFVDTMPDTLEGGVIYISEPCRVALHACCCGCGEEVSTPIGPTEYSIYVRLGRVTVMPSIGNHDFPCKSHYLIEDGAIVWAGAMSRRDIKRGRKLDRRLKRGQQSPLVLLASWIQAQLAKFFD